MRWPSETPAGTLTLIVRVRSVTPLPAQSGHGSSILEPVPPQSGHGSANPHAPWLRCVTPLPWQVPHTLGLVSGLAPLPRQVRHGEADESLISTVSPSAPSRKLSVSAV